MKRLIILTMIVAAPALAEERSADIVVTATRSEQPRAETGQAVTVLDRERIEQRQLQAVSDLLAETPGVTVSRNGGIGGFTGVRIRGAEAEQTLVLIDGVRINDPSSPGGGFDFGNLLIGNIERIEVLRGPNSVPWGSQAIGGVVNIVTATPTEQTTVRARGEAGYAGSAQGVANVSGRFGAVAASLGGGYFRTDGISQFAGGGERDGYRQYGANGRVEVALSDAVAIDLRGYYAHGRTELDGFPPPVFAFADTAEYSTSRELLGYAGLRAKLLDGRFTNRIAFTITDVNRDNFDPANGPAPSFIGRGRVERFEYQDDFRIANALRTVFGAERERSRFGDGFKRYATGIDSLYGQLIATPVPGLALTGGARYDHHRDFGGEMTFGANAAYTIAATGTLLRATYAEGFKAPTLFQLRSAFGNPDLQPERARSYDVGVEQRLIGDAVMASATWFRRRTRDQIDFFFPAPDPVKQPFGAYANIARTRASGVELALDARPTRTLAINASYSRIASENRSPGFNFGNDLARRPKDSASLSTDWISSFGLALGGTVSLVGDSFDDAGNFARLDGYALASVRAAWRLSERFELYGRIENLFDAHYQTVAGYGTIGRAAYVGVRSRL